MSHPLRKQTRPLTAALVWSLLYVMTNSANACSVPVFRYALEHWQPDPYIAIVFHRGELTAEQQSLVEQLQPAGEDGRSIANLLVKTVDLDQEQSEVVLELWEQHKTDTLPLLSLQTPPKHGPPQTAWFGELSGDSVSQLMNSPARQAVRKKLLGGESVVWVFLNSGKSDEDDAAFQLLNEELTRLQDVIELPPIEEQDLGELSVDPSALKIGFSSVRISRDDVEEQPLIEMLLRVEADLRDEPYVSQPMAFPVFARGRALYALVGDGITPETIEDASRFLAGACQCTVKAQNPGVDLMMTVDWEQLVQPALPYDDSQPVLAGLMNFKPAEQDASSDLDTATEADGSQVAETNPAGTPSDPDSTPSADDATVKESGASEQSASLATGTRSGPSARGEDSLFRGITLFLGLICAGVVAVTLIVVTRK